MDYGENFESLSKSSTRYLRSESVVPIIHHSPEDRPSPLPISPSNDAASQGPLISLLERPYEAGGTVGCQLPRPMQLLR